MASDQGGNPGLNRGQGCRSLHYFLEEVEELTQVLVSQQSKHRRQEAGGTNCGGEASSELDVEAGVRDETESQDKFTSWIAAVVQPVAALPPAFCAKCV